MKITIIPTLSDLKSHVESLPPAEMKQPTLFCTPLTPFNEEKFQHEDGVQYQITIVPFEQGAMVIEAKEATLKDGEATIKDLDKALVQAFIA